jgi:hypothetical protein
MIRSVRNNNIPNSEFSCFNYFNYVITPQIKQLFDSETADDFYNNFKQCVHYDYNIVINNFIKIKNLQKNQKFYFDNNTNIQIHSDYFGSWSISTYRYLIGLGRELSFNDLKFFIINMKKFIDRSLLVNNSDKKCVPKIKIDILISQFKTMKRGLVNLKETYIDDKNIVSIIDELIILI